MIDTVMPSQRRRARLVLILIAGIPLSMMLGATALWWAVERGHVDVLGSVGTANHGELIDPPRSVTDVVFQHEGVAETLWQDLPAKWRLLVVSVVRIATRSVSSSCIKPGKSISRWARTSIALAGAS